MKIIYAKYNRLRKEQYQIVTEIIETGDKISVHKKALTVAAKVHIKTMVENYKILEKIYGADHLAKIEFANENEVKCQFIKGVSLEEKILSSIKYIGKDAFFLDLNMYKCFVKGGDDYINFNGKIFSHADNENRNCNIDLNFDNIIIDKNKMKIIDYEWVYPSISREFIIFRAIHYFYEKNKNELIKFIDVDDIYNFFEIDNKMICEFMELEKEFQKTVMKSDLKSRYLKKVVTLDQLILGRGRYFYEKAKNRMRNIIFRGMGK